MNATSDDTNCPIILSHPPEDNLANSLFTTCAKLFAKNSLVDCTLSCVDGHLQVHRVVLASASTYLNNLLSSTPLPSPCSHPMLFLRNSTLEDTKCAMEYIYTGKTQTSHSKLPAILEVSQELGFDSLRKAIEKSMQNFETFRRSLNNNNNGSSRDNNNTQSNQFENILTQNEEEAENDSFEDTDSPSPMIAIVKTEMLTEEPEFVDYDNEDGRDAKSNNNISDHMNKIKRYATSMLNNSSNQKVRRLLIPKREQDSLISSFSHNQNEITATTVNSKNLTTPIILQHDKGEQFVYTNADFGMKAEPEVDDNESGVDDELDTSTQPVQIHNLNSILKGEIKQDDEVLISEAPGSCPWCMQVFTNLALLQKHIRSHVGNYRPFTCEYCQNSFARSAHLKRHLRTHTGEKPYKCGVCQRAFARQDKLKSHVERHLHNANKNPTNNMTITSYPPVSISQNSGGQVPIKVLLPAGKVSTLTNKNFSTNNNYQIGNARFANSNSNSNGLSISYASSSNSEQLLRPAVSGDLTVTPANITSSTTITPINSNGGTTIFTNNDANKRAKTTLNFLVK